MEFAVASLAILIALSAGFVLGCGVTVIAYQRRIATQRRREHYWFKRYRQVKDGTKIHPGMTNHVMTPVQSEQQHIH